LTIWPSLKLAVSRGPSTCDFTFTIELASTVPIVRTTTGTSRVAAVATRTGAACGPRGPPALPWPAKIEVRLARGFSTAVVSAAPRSDGSYVDAITPPAPSATVSRTTRMGHWRLDRLVVEALPLPIQALS